MFEPWVSVADVAAHLGVRKDSIYRWIERRGLPARKIGKLWKLRLSEVDHWAVQHGSASTPEEQAKAGSTTERQEGHLVLAVDDDESVRLTLCEFLGDEGYAPLAAADGFQALDLLTGTDSPQPSLIILDLGMPNMDGWQFRQALQRHPELGRIPIIVVTGDRRTNFDGAAAVLQKPLDLDLLERAMRRALEP